MAATVTSLSLPSENMTNARSTVTESTCSVSSSHEPQHIASYSNNAQLQYLAISPHVAGTSLASSADSLTAGSNVITGSATRTCSGANFASDYFARSAWTITPSSSSTGVDKMPLGNKVGITTHSDVSGLGKLKLSGGNVVNTGCLATAGMTSTIAAADSLNIDSMKNAWAVLKSQVVADKGATELCHGELKLSSVDIDSAAAAAYMSIDKPAMLSVVAEMLSDSDSDASDTEDCQSGVNGTFTLPTVTSSPHAEQRQSAASAIDSLLTSTVTRPGNIDTLLTSTVTRPSRADSMLTGPSVVRTGTVSDSPATQASGMKIVELLLM